MDSGDHLLSQAAAHQVPSTAQVLTVVFGMGTGVSPERIITRNLFIGMYFVAQHFVLSLEVDIVNSTTPSKLNTNLAIL